MSSYFYFTRHGQTIWNVENKICGATDIALTELGRNQARELGKMIKEENIHIDEILYSPLIRAADTAKYISEVTGIPCRRKLRLKEQNFGKYESTARDGKEFAKAKMNFVDDFDGGETMLHLCQRIYNLIDDIKMTVKIRCIFLSPITEYQRVVQSYFNNMTNEEFSAFGIKTVN